MTVSRVQRNRPAGLIVPLLAAVLVTIPSSGCKTGTATSKPSWWAFGGNDAAKLAAAPAYAKGAVEKPSTTAKPYPVTSTPQPYSLAGAGPTSGPAAPATDVPPPAAVTYGSTPPPRQQPPLAAVAPDLARPAAPAQQTSMASITPQVGPYTSLPGEPTAGAAGAVGADRNVDRFRSPPDRYADARPSDSLPAQPPAAATAGGRYGNEPGSRFGGGSPSAGPEQAAQPGTVRPAGVGAAEPATAFGSLPAQPPVTSAEPTASFAPAVSPPGPAGQLGPGMATPFTPPAATPVPARRPDPMYRPAGTSSYRPGKEILVGGGADAPGDVRPVGYDAPLSAGN